VRATAPRCPDADEELHSAAPREATAADDDLIE